MKRCPECEFIYEDDQSLCDMDGILLVFDSQQLPKLATSVHSHGRNRILPGIAALVLATILGLVYYVSTHRSPYKSADYAPVAVSDVETVSTGTETSTTEPKPDAAPPASAVTPDAKSSSKKVATPVSSEAKRSSHGKAKSNSEQKTQNSTTAEKDDSKIGSFMKKTGRLLKKPFKF